MNTLIMFHESVPTIFNYSNQFGAYPDTALRCAIRHSGCKVVLIGDHRMSCDEFVHSRELDTPEEKEFLGRFVQKSPNDPGFEIACFVRWFRMLRYMETEGLDRVFHIDSDVLTFGNPFDFIPECDLFADDIGDGMLMPCSVMVNIKGLRAFVKRSLTRSERSVQDMNVWFETISDGIVVKSNDPKADWMTDSNMAKVDGFASENTPINYLVKRLRWVDKKPWAVRSDGTLVRMLTLHFWQQLKTQMKSVYLKSL